MKQTLFRKEAYRDKDSKITQPARKREDFLPLIMFSRCTHTVVGCSPLPMALLPWHKVDGIW